MLIDQQMAAGAARELNGFVEREGLVAILAQDAVTAGFRSCGRMRIDRAPLRDAEALGGERLNADVVNSCGLRRLDACIQQIFEHRE